MIIIIMIMIIMIPPYFTQMLFLHTSVEQHDPFKDVQSLTQNVRSSWFFWICLDMLSQTKTIIWLVEVNGGSPQPGARWWFHRFFCFQSWGVDPIWLYKYRSKRVETSNYLRSHPPLEDTKRTFHQQFMLRNFFVCGGERGSLGAPSSQGPMWVRSLKLGGPGGPLLLVCWQVIQPVDVQPSWKAVLNGQGLAPRTGWVVILGLGMDSMWGPMWFTISVPWQSQNGLLKCGISGWPAITFRVQPLLNTFAKLLKKSSCSGWHNFIIYVD